jgi:hypothetical protein
MRILFFEYLEVNPREGYYRYLNELYRHSLQRDRSGKARDKAQARDRLRGEVVQSSQRTVKKRRKEREKYTDIKPKLLLSRYNFINPKKESQIGK